MNRLDYPDGSVTIDVALLCVYRRKLHAADPSLPSDPADAEAWWEREARWLQEDLAAG